MKTMTEAQAIEYIEKNIEQSSIVFALRGDDFVPAKKFRKSWNRVDGMKDTQKSGVCGMMIAESWGTAPESLSEAIKIAKQYGSNVFLMIGYDYYDGNDYDDGLQEVCIKDHEIICQIV